MLFMAEEYSTVYMCHTFIRSSVDGHLRGFHVLAIANSTEVNIGVHVSFQIRGFVFSGCVPGGGISGSHGSSVCSFLRTLRTVLRSGCTSFRSRQQWSRAPFPHTLASSY